MNKYILELFSDAVIVERIKSRLPILFHIAEQESSRAGRVGMGVGSTLLGGGGT